MQPKFHDDFSPVVDHAEHVRLVRRNDPRPIDVLHALRTRAHQTLVSASQGLRAADVVWHLPQDEVPNVPVAGDAILADDATRWTVLSVEASAATGRWRCLARDLVRTFDLHEAVEILRASTRSTAQGAAEPHYVTWRVGLPAALRLENTRRAVAHGREETVSRWTLLLVDDLALDHRHHLRRADGTLFQVVRTLSAGRVDRPWEYHVEPCPQ